MSTQELSKPTPAPPPVPPRTPNPSPAGQQVATEVVTTATPAATKEQPLNPEEDALLESSPTETPSSANDETSATEATTAMSSILTKVTTVAKPPSVTAEQMHVSIVDHLHLDWAKYELLDRHNKSLSLAARIKYQTRLGFSDSFFEEEAAQVLFVTLRPLFDYLEKCSRIEAYAVTQQRIIAVIASKGGAGKTPLACYLAVMLQAVAQVACLIIDANHNHGTTGSRLGIPRANHVLLFEALANFDLIKNYSTASMKLGRHQQTGLHALLSNPNKAKEIVYLDKVIGLFNLLNQCYHSIIADTGNGNEHELNEGSLLMADVGIVSALAYKDESFEAALTTMIGFWQLGHKEKIKNALKVINATRKEDTKEKFLQMFRAEAILYIQQEKAGSKEETEAELSDPDQLLEALGITKDNMFLVPFSNYIDKNGVVSLRPEQTGLPTLDAIADILLRAFEMEIPTEEEKKKEIVRRLEERKKESDDSKPSDTPPPIEGEVTVEWLVAELVKRKNGSARDAATEVLVQFSTQEKMFVRQ